MNLRFFSIGLFSLMSTWAFTQNCVAGKVIDAQGDALIGVSVKLVKADSVICGRVTDCNGIFYIDDVVAETYHLVFDYTGFENTTIEIASSDFKYFVVFQYIKLKEGKLLEAFQCSSGLINPLYDPDDMTTGQRFSWPDIRNMYQ